MVYASLHGQSSASDVQSCSILSPDLARGCITIHAKSPEKRHCCAGAIAILCRKVPGTPALGEGRLGLAAALL